jgi:hypothetical protein
LASQNEATAPVDRFCDAKIFPHGTMTGTVAKDPVLERRRSRLRQSQEAAVCLRLNISTAHGFLGGPGIEATVTSVRRSRLCGAIVLPTLGVWSNMRGVSLACRGTCLDECGCVSNMPKKHGVVVQKLRRCCWLWGTNTATLRQKKWGTCGFQAPGRITKTTQSARL